MMTPANAKPVNQFPIYHARGTYREMGRQHGEQAARQIAVHLDYMQATMKLSQREIGDRAGKFLPLFEKHCAHLIDELRGLAEGAGISFEEALAVNIRGGLASAPNEGCTTFVIGRDGTEDGQILIGQNSDMLPAMLDFAYVLHLTPRDRPECLMWTFGGMIGYHGVNRQGVAHFANDLGDRGPASQFALPHYPLKRLMLECSTMDEIVKLVDQTPLCANGNYVLCDGAGAIFDVEATTAGPEWIDDAGAGFIAHSNHYICPKHSLPANHAGSLPDSFTRLDRINELIRGRFGTITPLEMQRFLRDQAGAPTAICRQAQTGDAQAGFATAGITVSSIVAEPAKRVMHIAKGNTADAEFVTYSMD